MVKDHSLFLEAFLLLEETRGAEVIQHSVHELKLARQHSEPARQERHQAGAGQGVRKSFRGRALGHLGEEFPKRVLEMMHGHLERRGEVPPP